MSQTNPKISLIDDLKNQSNDKIEAIKKILPDCFDLDGNLIGEKLQEVLTENFEKPELERFSFNWAGKQKAREIAYQSYTDGTLKFDTTRSKNFDTTKNLIIEGDNLQVLKLLKYSYKGKVKCIYIDPPYNTGNDFVYNDSFELDIKKYLIETGEIDQETGEQMTDYIQKDDGKKHSKWLSFMYPRLMVAKELLREDGVIFVSIDDNEVHHLRLLMNEVFGEGNVETLIWNKEAEGSSGTLKQTSTTRRIHEYVICAYKNYDNLQFNKVAESLKGKEDELQTANLAVNLANEKTDHINYFTITNPKGQSFTRQWKWSKEKIDDLIKNNLIYWGSDGLKQPRLIIPTDERRTTYLLSILNYGGTTAGRKDFEELIGTEAEFSYPKPVILLKKIIDTSTNPNDLILDFFAGSGTTGQAVMELNQDEIDKQAKENEGIFENNEQKVVGGRKFILVQLPEKIDNKKEAYKAGYKHISDITIERVKRAGEKYQSVDNGFKVLELADNPDRQSLWSLGNLPINPSNNQFILTHLALMYGYGLNYETAKISEKEIYIMKSEIPKTKDAIVILEQDPLTMRDIMDLVNKYSEGSYKFFSRDSSLNIELTHNLLQHFREDNVVVF